MKADITVIVLTKNEEKNLPDCLSSLKDFASRVVVVDSFSTDDTKVVAESFGADFYQNKFINYSKQFNWGIDNTGINTKWTMRLDADERLTPELAEELKSLMQEHDNDDINGIVLQSWLYFLGKKIKHGVANKRKLMVFKTGLGRIEDIRMDERTILSSGKAISAKNRFIHMDFKDMTFWINKLNWYATREMQDYFELKENKEFYKSSNFDKKLSKTRKKKFAFYYKLPLFFRCWMLFIYAYIFRLGFLDGKIGFIYHWTYHRFYRSLVDAKILEQKLTKKEFEETGDLKC